MRKFNLKYKTKYKKTKVKNVINNEYIIDCKDIITYLSLVDEKNDIKKLIIKNVYCLENFSGTALESIEVKDNDSCIDNISQSCFENCTNLKEIKLNYCTICENAFKNCISLEKITFVTNKNKYTEIFTYKNCFNGCKNIKQISVGNQTVNIDTSKYHFIDIDIYNELLSHDYILSFIYGNDKEIIISKIYEDRVEYFYILNNFYEEQIKNNKVIINGIYNKISINDNEKYKNINSIEFDKITHSEIYINKFQNNFNEIILPYQQDIEYTITLSKSVNINKFRIINSEINCLDNNNENCVIKLKENETISTIYNFNGYYVINIRTPRDVNEFSIIVSPNFIIKYGYYIYNKNDLKMALDRYNAQIKINNLIQKYNISEQFFEEYENVLNEETTYSKNKQLLKIYK